MQPRRQQQKSILSFLQKHPPRRDPDPAMARHRRSPRGPLRGPSRASWSDSCARRSRREETPAMRAAIPRLKRVREEQSATPDNQCSPLGVLSKMKPAHPFKKKFHDEMAESARSKFEWLNLLNVKDANQRRPDDPLYDKSTLFILPDALRKMSTSQKQYWNIKCRYIDVVLFFKVGKFYELYELDSEIGQKELDWKMTVSGVGKC